MYVYMYTYLLIYVYIYAEFPQDPGTFYMDNWAAGALQEEFLSEFDFAAGLTEARSGNQRGQISRLLVVLNFMGACDFGTGSLNYCVLWTLWVLLQLKNQPATGRLKRRADHKQIPLVGSPSKRITSRTSASLRSPRPY